MLRPLFSLLCLCCGHADNPAPRAVAPGGGECTVTLPAEEVVKVIFIEDARPEDDGSDTLFYHQRAVQARDYRGRPRQGSKNDAVSFTSFAFDGSTRKRKDTLEITLILQVFWVKSASWTRTMPPSRHTLEHEQVHFNITRLVAERFRKKVTAMPLTIDDHDSRIQFEYLESFREMNRLQDEFDEEMHSGQNASRQQEWARRIRQALIGEGVKPADESI